MKIRAIILDVAKRQVAASPPAMALVLLVPGALDNLIEHIASNAAMAIEADLDDPEKKTAPEG
jgi:hypothetical protein